jgi:short-subunit dehydrogenase
MDALQPVTIVTGASAGIGAELAKVFAKNGHEVVLIARREPELNALAAQIAASGGKPPHVMAVDLGSADAAARIEAELKARGLEPEIVVNNAGFGLLGHATELDRGEQLAMIDLNMRVLTDLSLRFIDSVERHRGGILNVASTASFLAGPGMAVYHASKAYVLSFTEALHYELKPKGVRVTAVCPGPVFTDFLARGGIPHSYFPVMFARPAEQVARKAYEGLQNGWRIVVPGTHNRVLRLILRIAPRRIVRWSLNRKHLNMQALIKAAKASAGDTNIP